MLTGMGLVFLGAVLGVVTRRKEISLSRVLMAGSRLASHPERFVRSAWVTPINIVNTIGVLAFLAGVLVLVAMAVAGQQLR